MEIMEVNLNFWKNKRVLITGNTGFKGSWLSILLNYLGSNIEGLSLLPLNDPNLYTESNLSV